MEENKSWLILGTTEIWLLPLSASHFSELWASALEGEMNPGAR